MTAYGLTRCAGVTQQRLNGTVTCRGMYRREHNATEQLTGRTVSRMQLLTTATTVVGRFVHLYCSPR